VRLLAVFVQQSLVLNTSPHVKVGWTRKSVVQIAQKYCEWVLMRGLVLYDVHLVRPFSKSLKKSSKSKYHVHLVNVNFAFALDLGNAVFLALLVPSLSM
jgi:hypothetical protein